MAADESDPQSASSPPPQRLAPGMGVRLNRAQPYLKSADPMPMLRPPDLVDPGEVGQVLAIRPGQRVAVRFRRGSFLVEADDLVRCDSAGVGDPASDEAPVSEGD